MKQVKLWMFAAILTICGMAAFASCTANDDNPAEKQPTIERIVERGKLQVGTTGDYRPLSYREADGNYWGFGIEMAEKIAKRIGVGIEYVQTSYARAVRCA
jgi:cyclohexadienyl dehydratase